MKEEVKQTITYSREVCVCPICQAKHNKKIKTALKGLNSKCEYLENDYCTIQERHKCDFLISEKFDLCAIRKR